MGRACYASEVRRALSIAVLLCLGCDDGTLDLTPRPGLDAAASTDAAPPPPDRIVPDAVPPGCDVVWTAGVPVGWPYDLDRYRADVAPLMVDRCVECHVPGRGRAFLVRAASKEDGCEALATLASFARYVNLAAPQESDIYRYSSGGLEHPLTLDDAELLVLLAFIDDAGRRAQVGPPPDAAVVPDPEPDVGRPPVGVPLDFERFAADVQAPADAQNCGACHHQRQVAGNFLFHPRASGDQARLRANFEAVVARIDPADPEGSVYTEFATSVHSANTALDAAGTARLLAWIRGE